MGSRWVPAYGGFVVHAVYPGTFDPITPGHLDIIERARHLFARITVLVAVNSFKQPTSTPSGRAIQLRRELPEDRDGVSVAAWAGLTAAFCRQHDADVIIRGVRNRSDLRQEYQLAAMNQALGITTLLLPAQPELAAMSSTVMRGLGIPSALVAGAMPGCGECQAVPDDPEPTSG
jgi:pantetheine-phosphate adenylyltransferase